jgi:Fatty acid desaturase/Fatty acid hydroxylase superfamily
MPGAASALHYAVQVGGAGLLLALAWPFGPGAVMLALLAGWTTGSFAEYALHRFFLHGAPRFARVHARHHADPLGAQLDPFSYFAPFGFHAAAWIIAWGVSGHAALAHAVVAGGLLQYAWFRAVHRLLHTGHGRATFSGLARFHQRHHRHPHINFGVSTRLWDWLFGSAGVQAATAPARDSAAAHGEAADPFPFPLHDPCPAGDAPRNALERMTLGWLNDPRDLAFVRLTARALALLVPSAVLLCLAPWWLATLLTLPYWWLLFARFGGPVMLMVHAAHHRAGFTARGRWLERLILHGLPLLYGLQPGAYPAQHVLMHHAEGNGAADLSSTLPYRRDDWRDFLRYWWRFMTIDNIGLARYLRARRRRRALNAYLAGSAAFALGAAALFAVTPAGAIAVVIGPYFLIRFFLMAGNWAQHAFDVPGDRAAGTILINASHNARCFNDGYHALHHRRPGLHWAEMAAQFRTDWRHYAGARVLIFNGVPNNQVVWWRLMRRDHEWLARHLADTGWLPASIDERVALLKRRLAAPRVVRA